MANPIQDQIGIEANKWKSVLLFSFHQSYYFPFYNAVHSQDFYGWAIYFLFSSLVFYADSEA
jgi:hypothetical protein